MKRLLVWCCLATLCMLSVGCAATQPRVADAGYTLTLHSDRQRLAVVLKNVSEHELTSGGLFRSALPGVGYYLAITDAAGKRYSQCGFVDAADPGEGKIAPHGHLSTSLPLSFIKQIYCLPPGTYSVRGTFAIRAPDGPRVVARSTPVQVDIK